jgi:glycine cleavage system H protein
MADPNTLKFSKSHEWVEFSDDKTAVIGLSDHAQNLLGDLVFINLPQEGDEVEAGQTVCDVESVKAVSDVFSPVSGVISAVNEELADNPARINEAPYEAWLFKVENITETEEFLSLEEYEAFCKEEE